MAININLKDAQTFVLVSPFLEIQPKEISKKVQKDVCKKMLISVMIVITKC